MHDAWHLKLSHSARFPGSRLPQIWEPAWHVLCLRRSSGQGVSFQEASKRCRLHSRWGRWHWLRFQHTFLRTVLRGYGQYKGLKRVGRGKPLPLPLSATARNPLPRTQEAQENDSIIPCSQDLFRVILGAYINWSSRIPLIKWWEAKFFTLYFVYLFIYIVILSILRSHKTNLVLTSEILGINHLENISLIPTFSH